MADSKVSALSSAGAFNDSDLLYIVQSGVSYKTTYAALKAAILLAKYPEVANFAALPSAASHTGETYVCLAAQGVYFVSRKPAGFYYSDGANWNYVGPLTENYFDDSVLSISDDADPTKVCRFQLSSISTTTVRTLTVPDASGTIALLSNLGTAAPLNVPGTGDAAAGEVVKGNDSRLTDARTPTSHTHPQSDVTNLVSDLAGKAAASHTHAQSDVTGLVAALAGKSDTSHTHAYSSLTSIPSTFAPSAHTHAATDISTGTLDGDRLPGLSSSKKGGVPATGTPSGKYLKDDGTWDVPSSGGTQYKLVTAIFDGGGSVISAGSKCYVRFPWAGTITKVTTLADVSGSAVVDVWKDTYANYPPTVADTITASAKPTLSTATKAEDSTLTGWTTSITAGDVFGFNVDSCSTITRLVVEIEVTL